MRVLPLLATALLSLALVALACTTSSPTPTPTPTPTAISSLTPTATPSPAAGIAPLAVPSVTAPGVAVAIGAHEILRSIQFSQRADYATLQEGASIREFSSRLDFPPACSVCADPRDLIGGSFSSYFSGEVGVFIFGRDDPNQFVTVDLGQVRVLDQVGAHFEDLRSDREVYDFFRVLRSLDRQTFELVGQVGLEGPDSADFGLDSPVFFTSETPFEARFLRYEFGASSPDHPWGGSRVFAVYATLPVPPAIPGAPGPGAS